MKRPPSRFASRRTALVVVFAASTILASCMTGSGIGGAPRRRLISQSVRTDPWVSMTPVDDGRLVVQFDFRSPEAPMDTIFAISQSGAYTEHWSRAPVQLRFRNGSLAAYNGGTFENAGDLAVAPDRWYTFVVHVSPAERRYSVSRLTEDGSQTVFDGVVFARQSFPSRLDAIGFASELPWRCRIRRLAVAHAPGKPFSSASRDSGFAESDEPWSPALDTTLVHAERDGFVMIEAEHYAYQVNTDSRKWLVIPHATELDVTDPDPAHLADAGGGAYVEVLPDTRTTHESEPLRHGENFFDIPGSGPILKYFVYFRNPGTYWVWGRVYSTGTEDNGLHVGIDGRWPKSGARMQWSDGKHSWKWDNRQRTAELHTGVPLAIFLEVEEPGIHTVAVSAREDGTELDAILLTSTRRFHPPEGKNPPETVLTGK